MFCKISIIRLLLLLLVEKRILSSLSLYLGFCQVKFLGNQNISSQGLKTFLTFSEKLTFPEILGAQQSEASDTH